MPSILQDGTTPAGQVARLLFFCQFQGLLEGFLEVGRVGAWLLSPMSDGITAEIVHVDAGYNAMGSPGRMLDQLKS